MRWLSGYATLRFPGSPFKSIERQVEAEPEPVVVAPGERHIQVFAHRGKAASLLPRRPISGAH